MRETKEAKEASAPAPRTGPEERVPISVATADSALGSLTRAVSVWIVVFDMGLCGVCWTCFVRNRCRPERRYPGPSKRQVFELISSLIN